MEEDSMEEDLPVVIESDCQNKAVEYQIVESSTQRGGRKLVDNLGYSYTIKRRYDNGNAVWRCCIRNKACSCLATIRQRGSDFIPGPQKHCHQPVVGSLAAARITSSVKEKAMKDFYQPAGMIVQDVLLGKLDSAPCLPCQRWQTWSDKQTEGGRSLVQLSQKIWSLSSTPNTYLEAFYRLTSKWIASGTWCSVQSICLPCWQDLNNGMLWGCHKVLFPKLSKLQNPC